MKTDPASFLTLSELGFEAYSGHIPTNTLNLDIIRNYDKTRDFPAQNGTSKLGIHLRFGTVSIREMVALAHSLNQTWLNELIWREFYFYIMQHFPYVTERAFNKKYDKIPWLNSESDFEKWCNGRTGYPIVDAGMRELNTTGYMHNRVRMITASFLTKHLLIDWRWGESYFASKLLDFELASNNGGWQWAAGTGTDAQPWFRIFNPYTQAEKFDPQNAYIKKWVPEYNTNAYPKPMIDHKTARERAIAAYKSVLA
jgi:deoxyribodipyrimidine photo-lyase